MAGNVKELLEDIANKLEVNTSSAFYVGDSLAIADVEAGYFVAFCLLFCLMKRDLIPCSSSFATG